MWLEKIRKGEYTIQTEEGDNILPSLWDAIVKPGFTISIQFWAPVGTFDEPQTVRGDRAREVYDDGAHEEGAQEPGREYRRRVSIGRESRGRESRGRGSEGSESRGRDSEGRGSRGREYRGRHILAQAEAEEAEIYRARRSSPPSPVSLSQHESSEESVGDQLSDDQGDSISVRPELDEIAREPLPPLDSDGNRLSIRINTQHSTWHSTPTTQTGGGDNEHTGEVEGQAIGAHVETLRITKAVSADIDNRSTIQIHTLSGPEHAQLRDTAGMTWYHITSGQLDYARFKQTCLNIPSMSSRLQTLTRELLSKVEKVKVKAFLDGMFVEPGTVLRADERDQTDPQSVIFSCIPYFDLQPPAKKASTSLGDRLFPPRTLMQSYYPYEPVRDRDAEQAYRKFSGDHSKNVIQVPDLWMMNIGSKSVVTYGHKPLSEEMVKSIAVVRDDLKQLGTKNLEKNTVTTIRLTDWNSRVFLYAPIACRSYFQMEQKVRKLKCNSRDSVDSRDISLRIDTPDRKKVVKPRDWKTIVNQNVVFIDLTWLEDTKSTGVQRGVADGRRTERSKDARTGSVPPFFYWPSPATFNGDEEKAGPQAFIPPEAKQAMYCLEDVEKSLLSETIDAYDTFNKVDKSFTSSTYYRALPENTHEHLCNRFNTLTHVPRCAIGGDKSSSHHQTVVESQRAGIADRAVDFFDTAHMTLCLFVDNVDKSTMLRKLWGAMTNVYERAAAIEDRGAIDVEPEEHVETSWNHSSKQERAWFIRSAEKDALVPAPEADKRFARSIGRCRQCRSGTPFTSPDAALEHLQRHVKSATRPKRTDKEVPNASLEPKQPPSDPLPNMNLKDWVVNYGQLKREETNAGAVAILTQACETAHDFLEQAKELTEGVQNEDGKMSELYTLPRHLLEAFRGIVVFYLAIERALHYTEESYQNDNLLADSFDAHTLPFSGGGLEVLQRFGEGAMQALFSARKELCAMVQLDSPSDILADLSLGPEYVCAWLMRRLLVKPLENRMAVGDMYREYLSTIVRMKFVKERVVLTSDSNSKSTTGLVSGSCATLIFSKRS